MSPRSGPRLRRRHPESWIPDRRIPAVGIVAAYFVLVLGLPSKLVVRQVGAAGTPANLLGLLALLWWVIATVGGQNPIKRRSPVRLALGLLAVAVLLSYIAAMTRGWYAPADVRQVTDEIYDLVPSTVNQIRTTMIDAADRGLLSFGAWVGITLLCVDGLRSWADLDRLVVWLTSIAGLVAVLGIVQYFTGLNIASFFQIPGLTAHYDFGAVDARSVVRRIYATANHPIEFGVVMAGVFPLALHRTIYAPRSKWAWLPTVVLALAIPMSVSRSAIVVLAVTMLILFLGWPSAWRRRCIVAAPVVLVALRLALPGVLGTITSLFKNVGNDPSVSGRTDDYVVIFRVFADSPIFGRGLFTFVPRFYRILDNQILMFLLELGALGTAAIALLSLISFFCARGARRRAPDAEHAHLGLALSASIAGIMVSYATFDAWGFPMAAGLTFILFGLAGAAWQIATGEVGVSGAARGVDAPAEVMP